MHNLKGSLFGSDFLFNSYLSDCMDSNLLEGRNHLDVGLLQVLHDLLVCHAPLRLCSKNLDNIVLV